MVEMLPVLACLSALDPRWEDFGNLKLTKEKLAPLLHHLSEPAENADGDIVEAPLAKGEVQRFLERELPALLDLIANKYFLGEWTSFTDVAAGILAS